MYVCNVMQSIIFAIVLIKECIIKLKVGLIVMEPHDFLSHWVSTKVKKGCDNNSSLQNCLLSRCHKESQTS